MYDYILYKERIMEILLTLYNALPYIAQGTGITLVLVLFSLLLGFILGVPLALGLVYGNRFISSIIRIYVWFFRGVPILLLLFLFYFGIFEFLSLNVDTITASCVVLGLTSAAYQSQIFKASIQSLPPGQLKAAKALGMTTSQAIFSVILPQALRISIPAWSNEYAILLKDSALCFVLGTPEIMARTHFVASRTYEHLALYTMAGAIYLVITVIGIYLLRLLEKKVRISGTLQNI